MIIDFLKLVYHRKCFSMCLFCMVFKIYMNVILIRHASIFFPVKIDRHINRNSKVLFLRSIWWFSYPKYINHFAFRAQWIFSVHLGKLNHRIDQKKLGNNLTYYYMIQWLNNAKHSSSLPSLFCWSPSRTLWENVVFHWTKKKKITNNINLEITNPFLAL